MGEILALPHIPRPSSPRRCSGCLNRLRPHNMDISGILGILLPLAAVVLRLEAGLGKETAFDLHIQKLCQQNSSLILPHPHECQLYYDCSTKYNTLPPHFVQHMRECPFPDLFSLQTLRCEDFRHVKCGERIEYKSACEYRANQINVYHVMCTIQDVEGSNGGHVGSPGIMGLPESFNQDAQSTDFVNPKTLTNSRISLDELKKDLCSNKIQ